MRVQLFIGTKNGLFRYDSDARREHWRLSGPYLAGWNISALHFDPAGDGRLYAATRHLAYGPSIRVSEDGGKRWTELLHSPRFDAGGPCAVLQIAPILSTRGEMEPADGRSAGAAITHYAGTGDAGLFASRDGGRSWLEVFAFSRHLEVVSHFRRRGSAVDSIVVDPVDPRRLWVGAGKSGIHRTRDSGESWERCGAHLPPLVKMAGDPTQPGRLLAQTAGGLFCSQDGGDAWAPIQTGLPSRYGAALHAAQDGTFYTVPLESQTERYVKGGRLLVYRLPKAERAPGEWECVSEGLPALPYFSGIPELGLDTDLLNPRGVYLGTHAGEVFISRNRGAAWEPLPARFSRITLVKVRTCALP